MGSGEYRLYLERHGEQHDTWPAPPIPPSDSLPSIPVAEEIHADGPSNEHDD